jgi:hypothetical protein
MIYLNQQLVQPDPEKVAILKEVFPEFFAKGGKGKAVSLRNNAGHSHKAKVGVPGKKMRVIDRPNAGLTINMRARFYGSDYTMNEIVISSRPAVVDKNGNLSFGKNDRVTLEHGTMISDHDTLYFLYFYYNNISNGAADNKLASARFAFVMEEKERKDRIDNELADARIITAIASGLSDASVLDALRKLREVETDDKMANRDNLRALFRSARKADVVKVIEDILSIVEEEGFTQKVDVEAVVREALSAGKIKIEDGKLYLRKTNGEFSDRAAKVLSGEDDMTRLLEAVTYFAGDEQKLKSIS